MKTVFVDAITGNPVQHIEIELDLLLEALNLKISMQEIVEAAGWNEKNAVPVLVPLPWNTHTANKQKIDGKWYARMQYKHNLFLCPLDGPTGRFPWMGAGVGMGIKNYIETDCCRAVLYDKTAVDRNICLAW